MIFQEYLMPEKEQEEEEILIDVPFEAVFKAIIDPNGLTK
jgi:hypothetical protein